MTPRYRHNCEYCTYLGQFEEYDLYVCPWENTYLARFSCDGYDYISGSAFVVLIPAIPEAHRLATVQGIALELGRVGR